MFPRCRALWWATLTGALFWLLQPNADGPILVSRQGTKNYPTSKNKVICASQGACDTSSTGHEGRCEEGRIHRSRRGNTTFIRR